MTQLPDDELISAYLDGELSGGELARAEHLLATNAECRHLFEELTALRTRLRALPKAQLGDDFAATVLRRAEREMLQPAAASQAARSAADEPSLPITSWRRWVRPLVWSGLAAAAALLVMAFSPERRQVAVGPAPMGGELGAAHDKAESGQIAAVPAEHVRGTATAQSQSDAEQPVAFNQQLALRDFLARRDALSTVPEEFLVVRCDVDAEGEEALRQVLSDQKIDWEDAATAAVAEGPHPAAAPGGTLAGDTGKEHSKMPRARPVQADAVLVTARPEQLRAALGVLAKNRAFRQATVETGTATASELEALAGEMKTQQDANGIAADAVEPSAPANVPSPQSVAKAQPAESRQLQAAPRQLKQLPRSRALRVPLAQVQSQLRITDGAANAVTSEEAMRPSPAAAMPEQQARKTPVPLSQELRSEEAPQPLAPSAVASKQAAGATSAPASPAAGTEPTAAAEQGAADQLPPSAEVAGEPRSHVLFLFRLAPAATDEAPH